MKNNRKPPTFFILSALLCGILLLLGAPHRATVNAAAPDSNSVTPLMPQLANITDNWLSVDSLFTGDDNDNSYTIYQFSSSPTGPWTQACGAGLGGRSPWRRCRVGGLAADSDYYLQITFVDPDGVNGPNPQVVGPVHTPAATSNTVAVGAVSATVEDTHILVAIPFTDDSNGNSQLQVEVATNAGGPWTVKCFPYSGAKLCRVHGLTQGTNYWLRATVIDPDGVTGTNPQVLGPIQYTGLTNLAMGGSISADPGWGCCSNPAELIDTIIQNPDWTYGFAWCGGVIGYGGCGPGWKQATIDLGAVQAVGRVDYWVHDGQGMPTTWRVEVSEDGLGYTEVFATDEPRCRTATEEFTSLNWAFPGCGHQATFAPVSARYVRYSFDDTTLLNGIHGWGVELEVFAPAPEQVAAVEYSYQWANGNTGSGVFAFYDDGSFSDSNGLGGTWSYNPSASRLYLQYAGGQFCNALFVGRFVFPPGQFQGVVLCRDGSGLWGTWSGSIATGTVLDLAGMPAMAPTGESTHE